MKNELKWKGMNEDFKFLNLRLNPFFYPLRSRHSSICHVLRLQDDGSDPVIPKKEILTASAEGVGVADKGDLLEQWWRRRWSLQWALESPWGFLHSFTLSLRSLVPARVFCGSKEDWRRRKVSDHKKEEKEGNILQKVQRVMMQKVTWELTSGGASGRMKVMVGKTSFFECSRSTTWFFFFFFLFLFSRSFPSSFFFEPFALYSAFFPSFSLQAPSPLRQRKRSSFSLSSLSFLLSFLFLFLLFLLLFSFSMMKETLHWNYRPIDCEENKAAV